MKNISLFFMLVCWLMEGVFSETVSVKEGDPVTLPPQLPEIKKDDVIDWRFEGILIARVRRHNNPSVYEDELGGKFRDRLKLDGQTGDLTIKNFRKTDDGVYELSNSINTFKKIFNVRVSVHVRSASSGDVTPSGVVVLLVAAAVIVTG